MADQCCNRMVHIMVVQCTVILATTQSVSLVHTVQTHTHCATVRVCVVRPHCVPHFLPLRTDANWRTWCVCVCVCALITDWACSVNETCQSMVWVPSVAAVLRQNHDDLRNATLWMLLTAAEDEQISNLSSYTCLLLAALSPSVSSMAVKWWLMSAFCCLCVSSSGVSSSPPPFVGSGRAHPRVPDDLFQAYLSTDFLFIIITNFTVYHFNNSPVQLEMREWEWCNCRFLRLLLLYPSSG